MKKILAVSGGIDSMVMLHRFRNDLDVVVAHFNHGTRPSTDDDEKFVSRITNEYGLPFYSKKAALGENVSEEKARTTRYAFLNSLAKKLHGEIYTAHHADDLIESIAINLARGTGWRGLTPLTLHQYPFLYTGTVPVYKVDILKYAAENSIKFRQDPTNTEDNYLRNRLRETLSTGSDPVDKENVLSLWMEQKKIREEIEKLVSKMLPKDASALPRQLFTDTPPEVATELLIAALNSHSISLTRPQLADFLNAIKTYATGKKFNLPHDQFATISRTTVSLP